MRNKYIWFCSFLAVTFLILSTNCTDNLDSLNTKHLTESLLTKVPETTVEVTVKNHLPHMAKDVLYELGEYEYGKSESIFTKGSEIIRDSVWPNGFGKTIFARSTESIILDNMQRYIFPGSILKGGTVADCNYEPISVNYNPITVSVSFPAQRVSGVITYPSLSATRDFVNKLIQDAGNITQNASLTFNIDRFTNYDELKMTFGSNARTGGIFFNKSSSTDEEAFKVSKSTGICIKFVQKYFTLDMDIPKDGLVNGDISGLIPYSPVYVGSIAYGRMGVMTIETDEIYSEANRIVNEVFNRVFVKKQTTLTTEEQTFLQKAEIKSYILGGNGESGVTTITGYEAFIKHITEGGTFGPNNIGAPIYASFANLADHSLYRVNFKINIDCDPVYVRLEYRNERKTTNPPTRNPEVHYTDKPSVVVYEKNSYDIYLGFYSNELGTNRTKAPAFLQFNVNERMREQTMLDKVFSRMTTHVKSSETKHNIGAGIEYQLAYNQMGKEVFIAFYDLLRRSDGYVRSTYYQLNPGDFYKVIPPLNEPEHPTVSF